MNEFTPTIDAGKFEQLTKAADDPIKLELIRLTLSTAVPLAIADLRHVGGPSDWHFEQASAFATDLGAEGDNLLFRTKKTSAIMARFCEVVAILAFVPGGVTIFGLHFEACSCVHSSTRVCSDERLLYGICACPWCHRAESEALA